MKILHGTRTRDLWDGAGLCSPGRWKKDRRKLPEVGNLTLKLWRILQETGIDWRKVVYALACGHQTVSPFPEKVVMEGRKRRDEKEAVSCERREIGKERE